MLPLQEYLQHHIAGGDVYNNQFPFPALRTEDLPPRDDSLPIELSYMMGWTDYRRTQIARSLECLARQNWRNFEVLLGDDGCTQDMESVYKIFRPYLRMKIVRLERSGWSGCPSRALKALMPLCEGKVWAISQPEIMQLPDTLEKMYTLHFNPTSPQAWYFYLKDGAPDNLAVSGDLFGDLPAGAYTWVSFKPGYLDKGTQIALDGVDWHTDMRVIESIRGYPDRAPGLSGRTNADWAGDRKCPWWFSASAPKDSPIWKALPTFIGHGTVDMWMLTYRAKYGYLDITPKGICGYHQDHVRASIAPEGEQNVSV